jgi:hypothetical protein
MNTCSRNDGKCQEVSDTMGLENVGPTIDNFLRNSDMTGTFRENIKQR